MDPIQLNKRCTMDEELSLYRAFLKGDQAALEQLVLRQSDNLIRFAYLYVKDSAAAEDIAEDVFVALLLKRPAFYESAQFKTFLYRMARNKSIDYLRRQQKKLPLQDVEAVLHTPCFETEFADQERNKVLYLSLSELPEQYRDVLHLSYFENFSVAQMCTILRKNAKQIYNLLSRAKASLKELLIQKGVDFP